MGNWTKEVRLPEIEFDGDTVVFTVTRMLVEDMQMLSKFFDKDSGTLKFTDNLEVCGLAKTILPRRVVKIEGMKKADGTDMTREEYLAVASEFYFAELNGQLFGELMSVSVVKQQEKKL